MTDKDPNPPNRWRRWSRSRYVLPLVLLAATSSPLINWYQSITLRKEVESRLTTIEEAVKKNQHDETAGIKRLGDWVNKKLEEVKQIKAKLETGNLSDSEMRDIISTLMEILRTIKSILNFFCSFESQEAKTEFETMVDKTTDELERIYESPRRSGDAGLRRRLGENLENVKTLIEIIQRVCVFKELSDAST